MFGFAKKQDDAPPNSAAILASPTKATGLGYLAVKLSVINNRLHLKDDSPKTINYASRILDPNTVYDSIRCRICGVPWDDTVTSHESGDKHSLISPSCPGLPPVVDPGRLTSSP